VGVDVGVGVGVGVDVDVDVVFNGAVDVNATFVVGVDVKDSGGAHVHGAVNVNDQVNVNVPVDVDAGPPEISRFCEPSPRIELGTPSLPRRCTATVLRGPDLSERAMGLEPTTTSLEGWSSTS
jgi:hypothetical protein